MEKTDVLIIGAGPAGAAAALAAKKAGAAVYILERGDSVGGILNQCIHNGFGLHIFGEELTGPEYAQRQADLLREADIPVLCHTTVLEIGKDRIVTYQNEKGLFQVQAGAVVLATGCRERPRGAIRISGTRPAGVYSAGTAQRLMNIDGLLPGKEVVILGSGDIGLIMARRLTLEGARVLEVCELLPYSGGLHRNIVQCLEDFDIPLHFSTTVTKIHGRERVEGVTVSKVDENLQPIAGTRRYISCDTLLLSVGLIPENELLDSLEVRRDASTGGAAVDETMETSCPGVFACGNCLHVHDLADYASLEARIAGESAARFAMGGERKEERIEIHTGFGITALVPQRVSLAQLAQGVSVMLRVKKPFEKGEIRIKDGDKIIKTVHPQRLAPGEMIRFTLRAENVKSLLAEVNPHA